MIDFDSEHSLIWLTYSLHGVKEKVRSGFKKKAPSISYDFEKLRNDKLQQAIYCKGLEIALLVWQAQIELDIDAWTIDDMVSTFTEEILRVADEDVPKKVNDMRRRKRWWTAEAKEAVNKRRELFKELHFLKKNRPHDVDECEWLSNSVYSRKKDEHATQRREVKRIVKNQKQELWEEMKGDVEKFEKENPRNFFRSIERLKEGGGKKAQSLPEMVTAADGSILTDEVQRGEEWASFFQNLGKADLKDPKYNQEHCDYICSKVEEWASSGEKGFMREVDGKITISEVRTAIKALKNFKAPGFDNILNEMLKYGGRAVENALLLIFNVCLERETIAAEWTRGVIKPIFKKGDRTMPGNYRGLTMLSVIGKSFEWIIEKRLSKFCEENGIICDEQGGFRRKRMGADQMFIANQLVNMRRKKQGSLYSCFIDVTKAYDTVFREGLWYKIRNNAGIDGKLFRLLQNWYAKTESCIGFGDGKFSRWFDLCLGVRQGAILSPLLYSLFVNDLKEHLMKKNLGMEIEGYGLLSLLLYADDIMLIATSEEMLHDMLQVVSDFARTWRFELSPEKSEVVVFNSRSFVPSRPFKLSGNPLKVSSEYKYLGCELERTGVWHKLVLRYKGKARKATTDLWWAGVKHGGFKVETSKHIWDTMIRPGMEYGSEVFQLSKADLQLLESEQCHAAASILGVSTSTTHAALRAEIGWHSLKARFDQVKLRYWRNLVTMEGTRLTNHMYKIDREAVLNDRGWGRSWCGNIRSILSEYGFDDSFWESERCKNFSQGEWKSLVAEHVSYTDESSCFDDIDSMPKLRSFKMVKHKFGIEDFMKIPGFRKGKAMCLALRNGTNNLRIDIGRRRGETPDERVCYCCSKGKTENEYHFTTQCDFGTDTSLLSAYKILVMDVLNKYKVISLFDGTNDQMWFQFILGDLSILPPVYHMGGLDGGCARELYILSLQHIEQLFILRNAKLESLGLDERGISFIEPESNSSNIFNMYNLICDVKAPLIGTVPSLVSLNFETGAVT